MFQGDFPTCLSVPVIKNETKGTAESQNQEQKIQDVILLQGSIYSKTSLLLYTDTEAGRLGHSGPFTNPTANGRTFTLGDIDSAPCTLTGKELQEYAMCCTGEDADAIFRHEIKIILANDIGITLEDDKFYTLFWYVSKLQEASIRCVEDAEAAFTNHLNNDANRNSLIDTRKLVFEYAFSFLIQAMVLLFPALVVSPDHPSMHAEAMEDACAAKEELMVKNEELVSKMEELKRRQKMIQRLQSNNRQKRRSIAVLQARNEALERGQKELVKERDKYCDEVKRVKKVHYQAVRGKQNAIGNQRRFPKLLKSLNI
ncbi:MAG: hypothetical protein SGBAC_004364 [Bacillariaceae sp.]